MVMVTLDIPQEINKKVEHFKIEHDLKDKRDAILILLKACMLEQKGEKMQDLFKEVNKMNPIHLTPQDAVRLKKEVYSQ